MPNFNLVLVIPILVALSLFGGRMLGKEDGYALGQIDYANGIVKYKLGKQPNGTTIWKRAI